MKGTKDMKNPETVENRYARAERQLMEKAPGFAIGAPI